MNGFTLLKVMSCSDMTVHKVTESIKTEEAFVEVFLRASGEVANGLFQLQQWNQTSQVSFVIVFGSYFHYSFYDTDFMITGQTYITIY